MKKIASRKFITLVVFASMIVACEQPFLPEVTSQPPEIVVEGYIESGPNARPPYVILTRSQPFYEQFNTQDLNNLFVHGARVTIADSNAEQLLEEVCLSDLNPLLVNQLLNQFGLASDSVMVDICIYTDLSFSIAGEEGETYTLTIEVDGQKLSSQTTIPSHVEIDSFRFVRPSAVSPDSLRELRGYLSDPPGEANYYRFLTKVGDEPWYPGFNSVVNDRFFDGGSFEFPLPRGVPRNAEVDPETFGLFSVGDTISIRWLSIDRDQYDFWNTLEYNAINQGPFSSYTRVDTNIKGGLGIWGGVAVSRYTLVVE